MARRNDYDIPVFNVSLDSVTKAGMMRYDNAYGREWMTNRHSHWWDLETRELIKKPDIKLKTDDLMFGPDRVRKTRLMRLSTFALNRATSKFRACVDDVALHLRTKSKRFWDLAAAIKPDDGWSSCAKIPGERVKQGERVKTVEEE